MVFVNKEGQLRSGWKILIVFLGFIGAIMIYAIISSVLLQLDLVEEAQLVSWRGGISQILLIFTTIFCWKVILKERFSGLGLRLELRGVKEVVGGLLFGAISVSLAWGFLVLTGNAKISPEVYFGKELLMGFVAFILVGFSEEILGRGFIMGALRQTRSVRVTVLVSAIIFSLLHGANPGIGLFPFVNIFLVGVLLAYIYLKSGSIWTCIGYHISWNYFMGYIYGFLVSGTSANGMLTTKSTGNAVITGGKFGPEGGVVVTVLLLISIFFVKWYYRHSTYDFIENQIRNDFSNTNYNETKSAID